MASYTPRFAYTESIVGGLMSIEGARRVVDVLSLPMDVNLRLREEARRRMTHSSIKIEGNPLDEMAVRHVVAHPSERGLPSEAEARNYWRALEWIEIGVDGGASVTENLIRELHSIIYSSGPGRGRKRSEYRTTEIGVIGEGRNYEYMAPRPDDVPGLMQGLCQWIASDGAAALPAPIRAAILAYQFVTIHPFLDGNGRTARALATLELWRSGYGMRGFLSMEEYYVRDLQSYYANLQMGQPANYYDGRNDPDLTPWLQFFVEVMAEAAESVCDAATRLHQDSAPSRLPWEDLSRLQQQLLSRCLTLASEGSAEPRFSPGDVKDWFGVTARTARDWLTKWREDGFVEPATKAERIRQYRLTSEWGTLVRTVADSEPGGPE